MAMLAQLDGRKDAIKTSNNALIFGNEGHSDDKNEEQESGEEKMINMPRNDD